MLNYKNPGQRAILHKLVKGRRSRRGADFIKTCTGFGPGRATVHDIALIKETAGDRIEIKASGGVASLEDGVALMRAGARVVALRRCLVDQLENLGWPVSWGRACPLDCGGQAMQSRGDRVPSWAG